VLLQKDALFRLSRVMGPRLTGALAEVPNRASDASDVLRAALRLLEEQEAKLTDQRAALNEGEESGASTAFDFEASVARKRNQKPKTA
jgi:putative addiction module CopG family antidote